MKTENPNFRGHEIDHGIFLKLDLLAFDRKDELFSIAFSAARIMEYQGNRHDDLGVAPIPLVPLIKPGPNFTLFGFVVELNSNEPSWTGVIGDFYGNLKVVFHSDVHEMIRSVYEERKKGQFTGQITIEKDNPQVLICKACRVSDAVAEIIAARVRSTPEDNEGGP